MIPGRVIPAGILLAGMLSAPVPAIEPGKAMPECAPLAAALAATGTGAHHAEKVLLVDFWATWCPPCRQAMPVLNELRRRHAADGFEVIAINVDEDIAAAVRYLAQRPVDYPVIHDPAGDCPRSFGLEAMPSSYLVDRQRRIRWVHAGFRRGDEAALRAAVAAALAP